MREIDEIPTKSSNILKELSVIKLKLYPPKKKDHHFGTRYTLNELPKLLEKLNLSAIEDEFASLNRARFVLTKNFEIFFSPEGEPDTNISSHAGLSRNDSVLSAGTVYFQKNQEGVVKIYQIDNKSGHFYPDFRSLNLVLPILIENNLLDENIALEEYSDKKYIASQSVPLKDLTKLLSHAKLSEKLLKSISIQTQSSNGATSRKESVQDIWTLTALKPELLVKESKQTSPTLKYDTYSPPLHVQDTWFSDSPKRNLVSPQKSPPPATKMGAALKLASALVKKRKAKELQLPSPSPTDKTPRKILTPKKSISKIKVSDPALENFDPNKRRTKQNSEEVITVPSSRLRARSLIKAMNTFDPLKLTSIPSAPKKSPAKESTPLGLLDEEEKRKPYRRLDFSRNYAQYKAEACTSTFFNHSNSPEIPVPLKQEEIGKINKQKDITAKITSLAF
ncbi:MAG TPA: hypothetical protein VG895_00180 [Patescibacteria group bacterium]|nr:hypothetical protein [Gammaproteobacteria bacterium]HWA51459.1 hypothetical protein [Patescibacteria group bacterium]